MTNPLANSPLAALTTIFTRAPSCTASWLLTTTKAPSQFPPFPTTTGSPSCEPPEWATNIRDKGFRFYSPAVCPSGFQVGQGCMVTGTRLGEAFPPVRTGETAAYCVPSGHSCTTDTTDFRGGVWGATSGGGGGVFTVGPALQIRFRESDLSSLETHPLTPGLTMAGAPTTTATSEVTTTTTTTTHAAASTSSTGHQGGAPAEAYTMSPTITSSATTATASGSGRGGIAMQGSALNTGLIIVVVLALLAAFTMATFLLVRLRCRSRGPDRWREYWAFGRKRKREPRGLVPVGLGAWIGTSTGDEQDQIEDARAQMTTMTSAVIIPRRTVFLELDQEIGRQAPIVIPGLNRSFASRQESPAQEELDGAPDDENDRMSWRRASWVSRVLSRMARSSSTTRSSSRSRWTQRSLHAAPAAREEEPEKGAQQGEPGFLLQIPRSPGIAHLSSSHGGGDKVLVVDGGDIGGGDDVDGGQSMLHIPKSRSFDRLSQGTFGRVVVRGRTDGSSNSEKS